MQPRARPLLRASVVENAAPSVAADVSSKPPTVQQATAAQPSAVADSQRYAQRQSKSRRLQSYRGGDVVVIGASTLVIVLLIVLLIVILL